MFFQAAEDVNVTFEDQQKINKFARNTSRITELKEEIEVKKVLKRCISFKKNKSSLYYGFLKLNSIICDYISGSLLRMP